MNRALKIVLAVGLPATALAVGQSASASAPPTEPPGSEIGAPFPADLVLLTDDTGTITVMVPGSWTDVSTAPDSGMPVIEASTDRERYNETFDVAGMTYRATPFTADTETAAQNYGLTSGCDNETTEPYEDPLFVGSQLSYTGCGNSGTAEYHVIAANPADQAFTAVVVVQITGPDEQPILQAILDTFAIAASGTTGSTLPGSSVAPPTTGATGSTLPGSSVAPPTTGATSAFPPPTGEVPADWTQLVDDTQTIAISVPSTWTATRLVSPSDPTVPWISATTDEALFFPPEGTADTYGVPGVLYQASAFDPDTAARLEASSFNGVCTAGPLQTYDDTVFVGHIQSFTACDGTASSIVRVSANPADQAFTADLLIQLTGQPDDAETLNGLLLSFLQVNPGAGPATTVAGASTTTVAPGPTTSVAGAVTSTTAAGSSALVELLQQQLQDQLGVEITPEQGQCLLDNSGDLDPQDLQAVVTLLTTCGVDISNVPSG